MSQIPCQFPNCTYVAEHASEAVAIAMFSSHVVVHQQPSNASHTAKQKVPPIERPKVKQDATDEDWATFITEWGHFKRCTDIAPHYVADQLFQCCERSLGRLLLKEDPDIIAAGEDELLKAMKRMAVIKVATSVRRANLLATKQDHAESFREFYANVKAAAATCDFSIKCPHLCCADQPKIDYTPMVIKDILVAGVADSEIRKDVLGWPELDAKTDKEVVTFVEDKEIAQKAWLGNAAGAAGISGYKKSPRNEDADTKKKLAMKGKCSKCKIQISLYSRYQSGKLNINPFKLCPKCFRESRTRDQDAAERNRGGQAKSADGSSESSAITSFVGAIDSREKMSPASTQCATTVNAQDMSLPVPTIGASTAVGKTAHAAEHSIVLDHRIFTPDGWQKASSFAHPKLRLRISTCADDYLQFGIAPPTVAPKHIDVIADSGAQSCLWSRQEFLRSGFNMQDLIRVDHAMKAANTAPISIDGAIILRLSGAAAAGEDVEAAVMTYISPQAKAFFLSREALVQLRVIPHDFPQVGSSLPLSDDCHVISSAAPPEPVGSLLPQKCSCLKREAPPARPDKLPFACTPENAERMKEWLLHRYAASTFNKCPHQNLPTMEGPPIQIHINPKAKPIAIRTPAPVPLHWQEQVEHELQRDVALGVLERVPHGEPTRWCFRMVITRKHDGAPRRTVDLSPLNKFCEREAHASRSPFQLARSVPPNSVKTVCDVWNGYHSVPIREEDRHLTTFTTPWGLFRYKRAPQGFLSSGDGFNRRFDDIAAHIVRLERCVDDSLLHDTDLEEHWWRVIDFLNLVGRTGMIINPEKFQFSQPTVDFAGFRISNDAVEPLPKYMNAIREFPRPSNITDIRSWFGLVNQVSHYAQLRNMMEPFRKFLSPKVKFEWNDELDEVFEESKAHIIEAIRDGVKIFDLTRRTCLRTDWSKNGIGYFLAQQHCNCTNRSFGCCPDGWKITLAGSRFLSTTESNYAPIEGEALAIVWALEQTRFFTMGCNDLLVITDHEPLVKIFNDRRLDEIDNPRLFRLKRRTLRWRFETEYQPGKNNLFADATSRHPINEYAELASISMQSDDDLLEESIIATVINDAEKFFAITWERVKAESERDKTTNLLLHAIRNGFPHSKKDMPEEIKSYWDHKDHLSSFDNVVLYMDRIVIPAALRRRIVDNLHSAHQGVSGMFSRAQAIVFWPGISADIEEARQTCGTCHRNAPSQAKLPPHEPTIPTVPFEMIYGDYFKLQGKHFLIIGDRLSGWTEIVSVRTGSSSSGAKGLCAALRQVFVTFGVPEELSSDGGPEFIAEESSAFFKRWGVRHRLSSAYFPQSNGRAEVAVKMTKRLVEDNIGPDGSLNTDKLVRALLQQRNTPDRDCNLSPAEVLFGRRLRDAMPQLNKSVMVFESPQIHNQWHQAWSAKEEAIRSRLVRSCELLEQHSKALQPLREGATVFIQNQDPAGRPKKWDRQGTVVATGDHDQYLVRVHGSGRLTLRNRRFLRQFQSRTPFIEGTPSADKECAHIAKPVHRNPSAAPPAPIADPPSTISHMPQPTSLPVVSPLAPTVPSTVSEPQPSQPHLQSVPTPAYPSQHPAPRRSSRVRTPRQLYDAATGKSTAPWGIDQDR